MWNQIAAIWWAQFRTSRNHLPRKSWGSALAGLVSVIWYGAAITVGILIAVFLPDFPVADVTQKLPMGLLGVFIFWQIGPLFTLSSGWSLQLNKLLIYPIRKRTLFGIEVFLRLTTAPEMIPVLLGITLGLLRHPAIHGLWALAVLLFIPFNLFLSLAIREIVLHSFERNRFRELFTIFLVSIGILPQVLLRTGLGKRVQPYFSAISNSGWTPWGQTAHIAVGHPLLLEVMGLIAWTAVCFAAARRLFERSLSFEETLRASTADAGLTARETGQLRTAGWAEWPGRLFRDPFAALLQKELQSLVRMPRFRVTFGMACVFSVIVFIPLTYQTVAEGRNTFISHNFLVVVTLYGLLILSDALLLNVFGLDRVATQFYFAAPLSFRTVMKAKNVVAIIFMALQSTMVLAVVALVRMPVTTTSVLNAIGAAAVVGLFFLSVGNLSSVMIPRPADPAQTFRKQAGGRMQLWLLLCSLGMLVLVGAAYLAQWAVGAAWAGLLVLGIEFLIGLLVYRIALDSAVERGVRERERLTAALSKSAAPIGAGT